MHPSGDAVAVNRQTQRAWMCRNGRAVSGLMPFTAGPVNDAPKGTYRVFFKSNPWWGGGFTLRHFTAFSAVTRVDVWLSTDTSTCPRHRSDRSDTATPRQVVYG